MKKLKLFFLTFFLSLSCFAQTGGYALVAAGASTILPTIASGTWTPTITNGTNIQASTAYNCQYLRIGNIVTVSGRVDIDLTSTAVASNLQMSLPIASDFPTSSGRVGGVATGYTSQTSTWAISPDAGNNTLSFDQAGIVSTAAEVYFFIAQYYIL